MGKKRKIVIVGAHGGLSGVPSYINSLADTLHDENEIILICDVNEGGFDPDRGVFSAIHEVHGLYRNTSPLKMGQAFRSVRRIIRDVQPDIVWANSTIPLLLCRLLSIQLRNFHLVTTYHGVPFGPGRNPVLSVVLRMLDGVSLLLSRPHDLVFISQKDLDLVPRWLSRMHKVIMLHNCSSLKGHLHTDLERIPYTFQIGMVGRVSYQKNFMAAARLLSYLPENVHLHLVGAKTDDPSFQEEFHQTCGQDHASRVTFHGPSREVKKHLRTWDMLLFTSRYEGMSISALEGFQCGLPLASTDVGGMFEFETFDPFLVYLDLDSSAGTADSAKKITDNLVLYRKNFYQNRKFITDTWEQNFSPRVWQEAVRNLVQTSPSVEGRPECAARQSG